MRISPLALLIFLCACGDDSGVDVGAGDSGPTDVPVMFNADGAPDLDAETAPDAPVVAEDVPFVPDASADVSPDVDAGPSTCVFSFEDGLTGCGQECTASTQLDTAGCGNDYACFQEAWVNDTNPMISVTQPKLVEEYFNNFPFLITGQGGDSFCFRCTYYAALSCWNAACPDETTALLECLATTPGPTCRPLADDVSQCSNMDPAFRGCYGERINSCYQL